MRISATKIRRSFRSALALRAATRQQPSSRTIHPSSEARAPRRERPRSQRSFAHERCRSIGATAEHSSALPPRRNDRRGASWSQLMTKRVPPAMTLRTNFAGSTSSSNVNAPPAPQSARSRSETMDQDRLATLPLHGGTRTKPRRLGADLRTIDPNQKPAGQLWFIVEQQPLYRRILSAGMSYGLRN